MDVLFRASTYFLFPFFLSLIIVPFAKVAGFKLNIYAQENQRTVHSGKIVRMGGLAIYLAFYISVAIMMSVDQTILGILIGGFIVFIGGLLDDIFNLKPILKLLFQIAGALVAIFYGGISLDFISLPFLYIDTQVVSLFISFIWIVGVCNAINLIDGLDGLSGGISCIVLFVIGYIGYLMGRVDIAMISLMLSGAIVGFLPYNFHPASIFMGDCGALFLGYMIACISLLGFKTSTFITLGFPIIILFVPLADTCLAIIRRKLKGQKVSQADRDHLHHILMIKMGLGHRRTVLTLYFVTVLFGLSAVVSYTNEPVGLLFLAFLCILAWIFIELTGMINPKFHPVIGFFRRTIGFPKKKVDARFEANKIKD
ncbi:MAG: MraY family glycosyltransferase [Erysipelotrichaceae bacterium]